MLLLMEANVGRRAMAGFLLPAGLPRTGPVPDETYAWKHVAIGGGGFITGLAFDARGETRLARTDTYGAYLWEGDRWRQLVDAASMPQVDRRQDGASEGVYEIAVAPGNSRRLYMAINGWVYRSDDRGMTWRRASTAAPFPFAADPNGAHRMYGPFIAVDPGNPDLVLLGTPSDGLWRSGDGGTRWTRVAGISVSAMPGGAGERDLGRRAPGASIWFAPAAAGGEVWVAVPGAGVFVSADRGVTFTALSNGATHAPIAVRRGAFAADGSFYAVESEGKRAWAYHNGAWSDLTASAGLPALAYAAVAADPRGGSVFVFDEGGQAYRSTDAGASWSRVMHRASVGASDPPWLHVANQSYFATADVRFDPVEPGLLWVGAGTGVYHATPPLAGLLLQWVSQARGIEQLVTTDIVQAPGQAPAFAAWDFGIHVKPDLDAYSKYLWPRRARRHRRAAARLDAEGPALPGDQRLRHAHELLQRGRSVGARGLQRGRRAQLDAFRDAAAAAGNASGRPMAHGVRHDRGRGRRHELDHLGAELQPVALLHQRPGAELDAGRAAWRDTALHRIACPAIPAAKDACRRPRVARPVLLCAQWRGRERRAQRAVAYGRRRRALGARLHRRDRAVEPVRRQAARRARPSGAFVLHLGCEGRRRHRFAPQHRRRRDVDADRGRRSCRRRCVRQGGGQRLSDDLPVRAGRREVRHLAVGRRGAPMATARRFPGRDA